MKLYQPLKQEVRTYRFLSDYNGRQKAEIIFEFINDEGLKDTGKWDFKECIFNTESSTYTLEDFEFLSLVYKKIKELQVKLIQ